MFKIRFISMLVLLAAVVTGAMAQTISVKSGTEDATSWRGKAVEGNYHALPLEGVAAGTELRIKYSGGKLVKSVKATKKGKPAAEATAEDRGKLICKDGHIHAYGEDAECTAYRVAKIIYVGATGHATYTHGLALALTDDGASVIALDGAITVCNNKNTSHPVTNATWLLPSKDQWDYMMGENGAGSNSALRDGFSSVGGSNLLLNEYWSSTEIDDYSVWVYSFITGGWTHTGKAVSYNTEVRACLVF